jgi:hypothetical protein
MLAASKITRRTAQTNHAGDRQNSTKNSRHFPLKITGSFILYLISVYPARCNEILINLLRRPASIVTERSPVFTFVQQAEADVCALGSIFNITPIGS